MSVGGNILSLLSLLALKVGRETPTMVLMERRDDEDEEGDWCVVAFGETAEEDYFTAKTDEGEEGRGHFRLFKFFMREVCRDW